MANHPINGAVATENVTQLRKKLQAKRPLKDSPRTRREHDVNTTAPLIDGWHASGIQLCNSLITSFSNDEFEKLNTYQPLRGQHETTTPMHHHVLARFSQTLSYFDFTPSNIKSAPSVNYGIAQIWS